MNDFPPWPRNIDKRRSHPDIHGRTRYMTVDDEIVRPQGGGGHGKLIYIQKVRFEEDQRIEYRFCCYMIGVKRGARGRWVFAQFAPLIPPEDLEWLLKEARARNWPGF
jgi:hypothetical protein